MLLTVVSAKVKLWSIVKFLFLLLKLQTLEFRKKLNCRARLFSTYHTAVLTQSSLPHAGFEKGSAMG